MVPLLNRLEGAGLIRREPIDRKSQAIVLTAVGQERLQDARRITETFENAISSQAFRRSIDRLSFPHCHP